jgi:hypothetical protein
MRFLIQLFDFYIKSSIHVGLAVFSLVYLTAFSSDLRMPNEYLGCIFFGTILGYNFLKYFRVFYSRDFHRNRYNSILIISILAAIGFFFFFLGLNRSIQIHLLISGIAVLIYPLLRKFGWLKLFLVSIVVTYVTVYIPFQSINGLPLDFYICLIQRFLIVISLLIPFEILDSKTDAESMNTLPQLFGINRAKIFGILLLFPFMVLEFLKPNPSYSVIPITIITGLFIQFTTLNRNQYYTSFWVESLPVFWLGLLILFQ